MRHRRCIPIPAIHPPLRRRDPIHLFRRLDDALVVIESESRARLLRWPRATILQLPIRIRPRARIAHALDVVDLVRPLPIHPRPAIRRESHPQHRPSLPLTRIDKMKHRPPARHLVLRHHMHRIAELRKHREPMLRRHPVGPHEYTLAVAPLQLHRHRLGVAVGIIRRVEIHHPRLLARALLHPRHHLIAHQLPMLMSR